MLMLVLLTLFGSVLLLGPVIATAVFHLALSGAAVAILMLLGLVLVLSCTAIGVISRLYVRTSAGMAIVRTGMGGLRVIKDGGTLVIPVIHKAIMVTMNTIPLSVTRQNEEALITLDKLRADIHANFFVRVLPNDESITNAARSLGENMDPKSVMRIVEDKLVSALRQVSAQKTLESLNSNRDEFLSLVREVLTADLIHNGLTLETATISRLDQTDPKSLKANNIFDAQGLRAIAEITQAQLTLRNEIERDGEKKRAEMDVATKQKILGLSQTQAQAEIDQRTNLEVYGATQKMRAQQRQLETDQEIKLAVVAQQQNLQLAEVAQRRDVDLAKQAQNQAVKLAEVAQVSAVDIADRERMTRVALSEKARALAEAERAQAEAERAQAQQSVLMVELKAQAERDRTKQVIAAEAEAQRKLIEAERSADAKKYAMEKEADANAYSVQKNAEAQRQSAAASAEATLRQAEASSKAQELRALGQKAESLVPVQIQQEQMEVERTRVEVLLQEMEARAAHGAAAQEFELAKLRIEADIRIKVGSAQAMATMLGKINANVYGTPEDVAKMTKSWMNGMGLTQAVEGALHGVGDMTNKLGHGLIDRVTTAIDKRNKKD